MQYKGAGVILLGGASSRFGARNKADIKIGGKSCLARVYSAMSAVFDTVKISGQSPAADPAFHQTERLPDWPENRAGDSPLFGVLGALKWAQAQKLDYIVTMPTDLPFLTPQALIRLKRPYQDGAHTGPICYAGINGVHGLSALWPVSMLPRLITYCAEDQNLRISKLHEDFGALKIETPDAPIDPLFNMNRPEDEIKANAAAAKYAI